MLLNKYVIFSAAIMCHLIDNNVVIKITNVVNSNIKIKFISFSMHWFYFYPTVMLN